MKALVLGGSRFIGLHLVQELVRQGHEVTTFSRGQTPVALPPGVNRLYGDRWNKGQMRSMFRGTDFDAIFETSGYILEDPYDPRAYQEDIDVWLDCFLGRIEHFVFCSTGGVYAPQDSVPLTEDSPLNRDPNADAYVRNNVQSEEVLFWAYREHGFPVTVIRPTRVTGPDNYRYAVEASYFTRLLQGRKVLVPGDGNYYFQGVDVDDLAGIFVAAATTERSIGEAYNGSGPDAITVNSYIDACGRIVGVEPQVVHLSPGVMAALERPLDTLPWQQGFLMSMQKAREHLHFVPRYDVVSALEHAYDWYRTQDVKRMGLDFSYEDELLARYG